MNDVAVPELQPVVAVEAAEIAPSLDDLMWTRGVWLENAADAARAFPDLVVSEAALRMARSRRTVTNAYRYTPYREMLRSSSTTISYRRAAAGAKKSTMIVLTGALEEPEVWLISKLGALAHFKIEGA
jgi:hypothetical protein